MSSLKYTLVLCAGLFAASCGNAPESASENTEREGPLQVTCTIGMITDVAGIVGGDHAEVVGLMGAGVDPHTYKATQSDLRKLTGADVILYNGLHLEGRMADVLVKLARQVKTVQVTDTIPKEKLREPPEFEGHYDPHVWFDVSLWKIAAERIRDVFSEMDSAHQDAYYANAEAYLAELDELDAYAREQIATIPAASRLLITAHDAFGYFGQAYDIEVMGLQGISSASEYGLQDLNNLIDVIVERDVKAVFVETSVSPRAIEALVEGVEARNHAVEIGGELFSDAMGEEGTAEGTYVGMVRHNVDTIVEALK